MKESVTILKEALLTEKATTLSSNNNQYVFLLTQAFIKENVKMQLRQAFGVSVLNVNTLLVKPKSKRDRMRRK